MGKTRALPRVEYLRECFRYDPATGHLLWRKRPLSHFKSERGRMSNALRVGKRVGKLTLPHGYLAVSLDGRTQNVHRLIFKMHHGDCPTYLTHIDGNPANNRIENLRAATRQGERPAGWRPGVVGSSQFHGVRLQKNKTPPWRASIEVGPTKRVYLGNWPDERSAALAYDDAAKFYFGKHAVLNFPPATAKNPVA